VEWLGADRAKLPKQIVHMIEDVEEFARNFETLLFIDPKLFDLETYPTRYIPAPQ